MNSTRTVSLLVLAAAIALALPRSAAARGGGGCFLPDTPVIRADGSSAAIRDLQAGDCVLAFDADGSLVPAAIRRIVTRRVREHSILTTAGVRLRVTAEHPFYVGAGRFKKVRELRVGDRIFAVAGDRLSEQTVTGLTRVRGRVEVWNLETDRPHTYFAAGIAVHNKGCFPAGTMIQTPAGPRAIETLAPGDSIMAVGPNGSSVTTTVEEIFATRARLLSIRTEAGVLRASAEHPLALPGGAFVEAGRLRVGQQIVTFVGGQRATARILSMETEPAETAVFNLRVGPPHTFIAEGVVVHNKGCFLPDTPVLKADGSSEPIRLIRPGDRVMAFRPDGSVVVAGVAQVLKHVEPDYLVITTERAVLNVTAEHPFYVGRGRFQTAGALRTGDTVFGLERPANAAGASAHGCLVPQRILAIEKAPGPVTVYNLQTDDPHTFFAGGIAVHNKGGGSHRSYGRRGSSGETNPRGMPVFVAVAAAVIIFKFLFDRARGKIQNLDYCYPRSRIAAKAGKTEKLLAFIARQDPLFAPDRLRETARQTFLKLQECWQARAYEPMRNLLMPPLFAQHSQQLAAMVASHEINRMDNLKILSVDLVNVRYTHKPENREFTVLFTASATDYYLDDRTARVLRGDRSPAKFQEFWTFQLRSGTWLLREIEQTRESDALKDENFFEAFTDGQLEQVYGSAADQTGPTGPWLEKQAAAKATRIERMLNFLYETDKLWDRRLMLDTARQVFTDVYIARQSLTLPDDLRAALFPDVAENLAAELEQWRTAQRTIEYRNFCVRKVELVVVYNMRDNDKDEYCARIHAHAQTIVTLQGRTVRQDEDVVPFEEYWVFGRLDKQWKLKEVLPPAKGRAALQTENVDEDSSPQQVQWYYTKKRTV